MSEKLTIKDFGPIKEMSFEFNKINFLIGEQSTGKSTVAKLLAAINEMAQGETLAPGKAGGMRKDEYGNQFHFKRHLAVYEIGNYLNKKTIIKYSHPLFNFEYNNLGCNIYKIKNIAGEEVSLEWLSTTFIPADRIAVNLLTAEVLFSFIEKKQSLPGYFINFGRLFNKLKLRPDGFDFSDTLGVFYKSENELDKIELPDKRQINISEASSAIQTNTPLLVVLSHQSQTEYYKGEYSPDLNLTVIEEPELNSFPLLQNALVKYIIRNIHPAKDIYLRRLLITTHSPYILTSANNLMYAFLVGQNHPREAEAIIQERFWLNPKYVSAYMMNPDGTCQDILDRGEASIKAEKIDEVSRKLNSEFDSLQNIELGIKV